MGIFKAYDVRGEYPGELNEEIAGRIGASLVKYLDAKKIAVGHDMRLSSPPLARAFIEGARSAGAHVTNIGMVTTPHFYWSEIEGKFDGGAMITASHLPGNMNGLKIVREYAIPLSSDHGLPQLEQMVKGRMLAKKGGGSYCESRDLEAYISRIREFVHDPRPIKLVIDAGNGIAGPEVAMILEKVPQWEAVTMYMDPNGTFPHHLANPLIADNTRELQKTVIQEKAALGVAFDGDADRCGFIDEHGHRIREDLITALITEFFLYRNPGSKIIYDLRSSRVVPQTISRLGGVPVRSRVGHSFIKDLMRKENAVFAGELSGHYYYRDMGCIDNALLTMVHMLNLLAYKKKPVSELIDPLQKYSQTGEINFFAGDREAIYRALQSKYADSRQDCLDGLTVTYDKWWFNLRASNTEPLLRLNLEAENSRLMEQKKDEVLEIIRKSDPAMELRKSV